MKKLMTMFASAATLCAFGVVNAEGLTSTGFETAGYVAGENLDTSKDDAGLQDGAPSFAATWVNVEPLDDGVATVTAYGGEGAAVAADVATATGVAVADLGSNYLKLDSAPLISRYAQAGGGTVEMTSEGVYIDTLVQFTVSEDTPDQTTEDGDKLCIWVNVDSATGATNLMVKAGYISDDSGENITPTAYTTDYSFGGDDNGWHRLTVKAIAGIDQEKILNGFLVYVDGVPVKTSMSVMCDDWAQMSPLAVEGAFPSLISSLSSGGGTLESIGFKGSGSIDNLQFTTTNPLPTPSEDDWVDDPDEIPANTTAATQYPALASSALATADAKKLTVWATANSITFDTIKDDTTGTYTDAYLLNCALAEVEDEKDEFVVNISFDSVTGEPVVTEPTGKTYNGTFKVYGSDDLTTPKASWHEQTDGDTFFYGVLSL